MARVLSDAVRALDRACVPYVAIGGVASSLLGRPRCTSDIDLLVAPEDAPRALAALGAAGFATEETNPHWLFKAYRDDVLVDLLFRSSGGVYLDAEMLARAGTRSFRGFPVRVIPPEDLIVVKAIAHDEETPRHWWDALAVLCESDLDWSYFVRRARKAPKRLAGFLLYAQSLGLDVPSEPLRRLAGVPLDLAEPPA